MYNLKVWMGFVSFIVANILILSTNNMCLLGSFCVGVYCFSYFAMSKKDTAQRSRTFVFIGLSLLFFQLVFNQSVPVYDRTVGALRVTLQIASISQMVFLVVHKVSTARLVQALGFLPNTWQLLLTMTFTLIPVLSEEQGNIYMAQLSRGLGLTSRSRLISPIASFVPLMHRILQRSETMGFTLLSRGFET